MSAKVKWGTKSHEITLSVSKGLWKATCECGWQSSPRNRLEVVQLAASEHERKGK